MDVILPRTARPACLFGDIRVLAIYSHICDGAQKCINAIIVTSHGKLGKLRSPAAAQPWTLNIQATHMPRIGENLDTNTSW